MATANRSRGSSRDVFIPAAGTTSSSSSGQKKLFGVNRWAAIGLIIIAAGGAYLLYRHYQANAAASSTPTAATTGTGIDPNTGIPYADESGLAGGSGSGAAPTGPTPTGGNQGALAAAIQALASDFAATQTTPATASPSIFVVIPPAGGGAGGGSNGKTGATNTKKVAPTLNTGPTVGGQPGEPIIDFAKPGPTPTGGPPALVTGKSGPNVGGFTGAPAIEFTPLTHSSVSPRAQRVTANKTGATAVKGRGVVSIH